MKLIRGMPHDRQLAEIGGSHWSRGPLPYQTSGTYGAGKSTWRGSSLPVNYQGKEAGSPPLPGTKKPGATPSCFPFVSAHSLRVSSVAVRSCQLVESRAKSPPVSPAPATHPQHRQLVESRAKSPPVSPASPTGGEPRQKPAGIPSPCYASPTSALDATLHRSTPSRRFNIGPLLLPPATHCVLASQFFYFFCGFFFLVHNTCRCLKFAWCHARHFHGFPGATMRCGYRQPEF